MALAETAKMIAELSFKDKLTPGVNKAIGSVGKLESSFGRVGKGAGQLAGGALRVGTAVAATAITLAGAASKIGMDFDDAFAGVKKTVDASDTELATLRKSLVQLSTRIPISFTDLAGIAQEAGALGVATKDVDKFTEAVSRTAAATVGLSPEAAAEAFGKLGNILHLTGTGYSQLGSALVELGNSAASSEGDIIEVAQRFGATGKAAGLSGAQILGWSSAIASLGPEAEAAGSSLSRVFGRVIQFAGTGNDKLDTFAKTAGLTTKQFKAMLRVDPSKAMFGFIKGLGKLDKFQLAKTLKDAGITNIRDINAIQLLSQNTDLLSSSLDTSNKAWKENTALVDVSDKRFDTFKNHLIELKNTGFAAADAFAGGLNPALDRLSKKAATFVASHMDDFANLGKDFGKAVDEIDWAKVESGAKTALDVAKGFLAVLQKVPPELLAIGAGLAGVNKLSGGLLGAGAGNVIGGLAGAIAKGVAAKAPVVGSLFAQPVFVTNWPLGGLGGGGLGGAGKGLLGLGGFIPAVAVATISIAAAGAIGDALDPSIKAARDDPSGAHGTNLGQRDPRRFNDNGQVARNVLAPTVTALNHIADHLLDRGGRETGKVPVSTFLDKGGRDEVSQGIEQVNAHVGDLTTAASTWLSKNHDAAVAIGQSVDAGASGTKGSVDAAKGAITAATYTGASIVASAVRNNPPPIVNVAVSVTPSQIEKTTTIVQRNGPTNGSSGGGGGGGAIKKP